MRLLVVVGALLIGLGYMGLEWVADKLIGPTR